MPWIIAILLQGLLYLTKSFVGRVLVSLGLGVVTYTGMSTSLTFLKTQALTAMGGMGSDAIAIMSYMKVGVCISIITSAIAARMLVTGLQSDTVKRWVLK